MRIIKEMFNPVLKCRRKGHSKRQRWQRFIVAVNNRDGSVSEHRAKAKMCMRCRRFITDVKIQSEVGYYRSYTASAKTFREMDKKGYSIVVDQYDYAEGKR